MTYNVHRCVGTHGGDSTIDVGEVCAEAGADIVALQELDAPETDEDEGQHHARDLAERLGMKLLFCRTFRRGVGFYGHALLSRWPLELQKVTTFAPVHEHAEPRGAIWARASLGPEPSPEGTAAPTLDIISTHLGVTRRERAKQSRELASREWLDSPAMKRPLIVCGDLNAIPIGKTYRRLASRLGDSQKLLPGHAPKPTFPSFFPVVRLDHVFVSPEIAVRGVTIPYTPRSRRASDHLPLIVDLSI